MIIETQQASDYIVVANQIYLHQLSLDGNQIRTVVSGLSFAVAVDFDFRFSIIIIIASVRMLSILFGVADKATYIGQIKLNVLS